MSETPSEKIVKQDKAAEQVTSDISEDAVVAYLREHNDFFEQHQELLEHLALKHPSGKAVSLIERQVDVVRARNHQLQQRLASLLETARENEARVWHLNSLARVLITAESVEDIIKGLETCLSRDFGVDALFLGIKIQGDDTPEEAPVKNLRYLVIDDPVLQAHENFFRMGQVVCSVLAVDQANLLFPKWKRKKALRSMALVPLGKPTTAAMLALASTDEERFQPDMGTMFLDLMADLVAAALRDLITNPSAGSAVSEGGK